MKIEFFLHEQTKEIFDDVLERWEVHEIKNETVLFWQPKNKSFWKEDDSLTMDAKIELIIEHDGLNVDRHCYLSSSLGFDDGVHHFYNN